MKIKHRHQALLKHLSRGRRTARSLAHATGAGVRTIYRDIQALRADGYAIDGAVGPGGGFVLRDDCKPLPLSISTDAIWRLAAGLAAIGGTDPLVGELVAALPPGVAAELRMLLKHTRSPTRPSHGRQAEYAALRTFAQGLLHRRMCWFVEARPRQRSKNRIVEPLGMVYRHGRWVLEFTDWLSRRPRQVELCQVPTASMRGRPFRACAPSAY